MKTMAMFGIALTCALVARADDFTRMVDAGGYKVRMRIEGEGRVVVFISGGFGGRFESWMPLASKLKSSGRAVLYDRGGSGESEAAPAPRDSKHIASELRTALQNAGVKGPWVIVGQSLGGIHARVFAHEYPQDVAGLVLIDPTAEDYGEEFVKARGEEARREGAASDAAMAAEMKKMPAGVQLEYNSLNVDFQQAREAWPLPMVPMLVITSLHPGADLNHASPMLWLALHRELANRAGAKQVVTETLGHNMQNEDPEFVAKEIRELIR
jgi:pimeloyl-ACP methyl ester carboxylesterase